MTSGSLAGVVLAAGGGTRFGQPKAPVVVNGERLVDRAVRCLGEAGCDPVIVVLGAWIGPVPGAEVVVNDDWRSGVGSSLRAGLDALDQRVSVAAALVTLVDLPGQTAAAARRVADASTGLAVATFNGAPGHPVRLPRDQWAGAMTAAVGDSGARSFLSGREDVLYVEVSDVAEGHDLDVPSATPTSGQPR